MRSLIAIAALILATAATPRHAPHVIQPGHIDLERGPDGNTVILDTASGLIVIDSGRHPEHAQAILDLAKRVGKPVAALVNTHWHLDHTTGNRDIRAAWPGVKLIATGAAASALEGFLAPSRDHATRTLADPATPAEERARVARAKAIMDDRAALVPAEPVSANRTWRLGGRRFELRVAQKAATEADLWMLVPDERLAVVGDLVVAQVPFFDTGCEQGWRTALDAIASARWTTLIPGHGAAMRRAEFNRWHIAFNTWLDCAGTSATAATCAEGWMRDAKGFYTEAEAPSVRMMAQYYVAEVLRAPAAERMAYCSK